MATPALVQKKNSIATATTTFDTAPTLNNLITAQLRYHSSGTTTMPQVTSTGWTKVVERISNDVGVSIWAKKAGSSESASVVTSWTSGGTMTTAIAEYNNFTALTPWDETLAYNSNTVLNGTSLASGSVDLAKDSEGVAVAVIGNAGVTTTGWTWSNSFVQQLNFGNNRGAWADRILSATGSYSTTVTWNAGSNASIAIAVFYADDTAVSNKSASDTLDTGITEASLTGLEKTGTDSLAAGVSEGTSEPYVFISGDETLALAVTETSALKKIILPAGLASTEAFGTPTLIANRTLLASSIPSAQTFSTPVIYAQAFASPSAIPSLEAVGTPSLQLLGYLTPPGIPSLQALGTPSLSTKAYILVPSVPSGHAFGTLTIRLWLLAAQINSAQALGTPVVNAISGLVPPSIASAQAFGTAVLKPTYLFTTTGIPSAQAFGAPKLSFVLRNVSLGFQGAFGTPGLLTGGTIAPTGVLSAEAFGTTKFGMFLQGLGIPTVSVVGHPLVGVQRYLTGQGIPSTEAFGTPQIRPLSRIISQAIPSGQAFGVAHTLHLRIHGIGLASAGAFGTAVLYTFVSIGGVSGIPSAEAFGIPVMKRMIAVIGIPSGEAFGTPMFDILGTDWEWDAILLTDAWTTKGIRV